MTLKTLQIWLNSIDSLKSCSRRSLTTSRKRRWPSFQGTFLFYRSPSLTSSISSNRKTNIHHSSSPALSRLARLTPEQQLDLTTLMETARKLAPSHPHPFAPHTPPANILLGPVTTLIDSVKDAMGMRKPLDQKVESTKNVWTIKKIIVDKLKVNVDLLLLLHSNIKSISSMIGSFLISSSTFPFLIVECFRFVTDDLNSHSAESIKKLPFHFCDAQASRRTFHHARDDSLLLLSPLSNVRSARLAFPASWWGLLISLGISLMRWYLHAHLFSHECSHGSSRTIAHLRHLVRWICNISHL